MWHPHAAPWGMQSERFNQQSLRERRKGWEGASRGNRRVGSRDGGDADADDGGVVVEGRRRRRLAAGLVG